MQVSVLTSYSFNRFVSSVPRSKESKRWSVLKDNLIHSLRFIFAMTPDDRLQSKFLITLERTVRIFFISSFCQVCAFTSKKVVIYIYH